MTIDAMIGRWLWAAALLACSDGSSDTPKPPPDDAVATADALGPSDGGAGDVPRGPLPDVALGAPCNGRPALCDRPYDRATFLTTHGAVTNDDPLWQDWKTQHRTVREQLDLGVRAIMLEAHAGPVACLWDCARGSVPLATPLSEIKAFLDVNPREVMTLLFDGDAPIADLTDALRTAGLDALAHDGPSTWPTLGAMIDAGKRVVVFVRDTGDAGALPGWILPFSRYGRETRRANTTVQGVVACALDPADSGAPGLTLVHEYLVSVLDAGTDGAGGALAPAAEDAAKQTNALAALTSTRSHCGAQGASITFLAVDFFETGDAREFVNTLADVDAGL